MRKLLFGLAVLVAFLALGGIGNSVSRGEGDRVTAVEGGYWHDEPCCVGDMPGAGALCWHSIDNLK